MGVDNLRWENVKNQFEQDYRAAPRVSSVNYLKSGKRQ
jgi:hypothetical protein